jgi:LmbE family N-acetylglucosaminyl deacetylase
VSRILVIAPHPDDETLGCGGTLLKHRSLGDEIHWLIVTAMHAEHGFSAQKVEARPAELRRVHDHYGFASRQELNLPATRLETLPLGTVIQAIGGAIRQTQPDTLYLPWPGDAHTDHKIVFAAANAVSKWFRTPDVRRILAYETPSETGFNLDPNVVDFRPNWFVDITGHLDAKQQAMTFYEGELAPFPFPRSPEVIDSLARLRGSLCGCEAAEAFVLLKGVR